MRKLIPFLCLLLAGGRALLAAGNYSLQIGDITWIGSPGGYNCFSSIAYPNTVNFTITKEKGGNRPYAVTAGPSGNTGTYTRQLSLGASRLNYQLYTSSSMAFVLEAPPTANANQVISGSSNAKKGTIIPLAFTFYIPPNQLVPPGVYSDGVSVSVYRNYSDRNSPQDTQNVTISAFVAPVAILSLVPSGSGFNSSSTSQTMDFGTLAQGKVKTCDLLVRKNTACTVTFSSNYHGVLKTTPASAGDQVPYTCEVNGTLLNLAQTASISLPPGVSTSQDGTRLPVKITIGDLGNAAAGDYRDDITITVTVQ